MTLPREEGSEPQAAPSPSGLGLVPSQQVTRDASHNGPAPVPGEVIIDGEAIRMARLGRMKRGTMTRARLLATMQNDQRGFWAFLTLTYANADDWHPRDVSRFTNVVRSYLARRGIPFRYTWVIELQKRGAPHYHLLVWLPQLFKLPKPDDAGWWRKGSTNIQRVKVAAAGYVAKYASKQFLDHDGDSLRFPKGARLSGGGGLDGPSTTEYRWWLAPRWLRLKLPEVQPVRRVSGGYVTADGELHRSPMIFDGVIYDPGGRRIGIRLKPRPAFDLAAA
jgi:hypothetical protein